MTAITAPLSDDAIYDDSYFEPGVPCELCGGSGVDPLESFLSCPHCDGEGFFPE